MYADNHEYLEEPNKTKRSGFFSFYFNEKNLSKPGNGSTFTA